MQLRGYQQEAVDAAVEWFRQSLEPALIDAAPASGKSFMIAGIAQRLYEMSGGKRVLCLAPSKELVQQNHEKYLLTGNPASVFSASAGKKCLRHPVVYGTPGTVKNSIRRLANEVCLIVIDECHEWGATLEFIVDKIRELNPKVRVLGLSGTPFRTKEGYIYRYDHEGRLMSEDVARNPYFAKCVYQIDARTVLAQGNLCPMRIGDINTEAYDTSGLIPNGFKKKFTEKELDRAFVGHGRKTALIVADVLRHASGHPGGVMLFAATRQHAEEIYASLPPEKSAIVTGETAKKKQRDQAVKDYKARHIRYLVSVGTLTTGFDAPWTSIIALLRKSESPSLLQQMMGRAWRPYEDKEYSLLLDYGGNIEDHFPDGDIYAPEIRATYSVGSEGVIKAKCPVCSTVNEFGARKNDDGYKYDEEGYFLDLDNNRIMLEAGPIPGHYGRRCQALLPTGTGNLVQCNHRWSSKECHECGEDNDIAARYCASCRAEIIDPNEKLIGDFKRYKRDPSNVQVDKLVMWSVNPTTTAKGRECIRVDWTTEYRKFSTWYFPDAVKGPQLADYLKWLDATGNGTTMPETITYKKQSDSKFYRVFSYNQPEDSLE